MHANRLSPARKFLAALAAAALVALFAGCESVTLTNMTPASMPENPSQIYTFTLRVQPRTNTVPPASIRPHVITDGQAFAMRASAVGGGVYEFEYQLPAGRDSLSYYFLVNFETEGNNVSTPREVYTEVSAVKIARRYVRSLDASRGPVGARISIVGGGFTPQDVVYFSGRSEEHTSELQSH